MRVAQEVNESVQLDEGNVVVEVARLKLGVHVDAEDVELDVGVELAVVVDVPLAQSDPQLLRPKGQSKCAKKTKHTGCSVNIVFFSLKWCDFSELCQFCCSACFLPALCVYRH